MAQNIMIISSLQDTEASPFTPLGSLPNHTTDFAIIIRSKGSTPVLLVVVKTC